MNWSGGKDACMALHYSLDQFHISKLVTSVSLPFNRVTMHGVPRELLVIQAQALGLPLKIVELPAAVDMETYGRIMGETVDQLKEDGCKQAIFGDIFLEDLKKYREEQLQSSGIKAVFPLWKADTRTLVETFCELGYRAVVVCANAKLLDKAFLGREINQEFLADLPKHVDPCGENGEFHTFVFDGPIFKQPVPFTFGEIVLRSYPERDGWDHQFWYCDLQPL